jgi:hypothetical protein
MLLHGILQDTDETDVQDESVMLDCKDPGCGKTFPTLEALQDHIDFGEHRHDIETSKIDFFK